MPAKPDELMGILEKWFPDNTYSQSEYRRIQAHTAIKELQKRERLGEEDIEKVLYSWIDKFQSVDTCRTIAVAIHEAMIKKGEGN